MIIEINLVSAKIEELEKLKSLIENTIVEKEKEKQRNIDIKMINKYREVLVTNIKLLLNTQPTILEFGDFIQLLHSFEHSPNKTEFIKIYFGDFIKSIMNEISFQFHDKTDIMIITTKNSEKYLTDFIKELERI